LYVLYVEHFLAVNLIFFWKHF